MNTSKWMYRILGEAAYLILAYFAIATFALDSRDLTNLAALLVFGGRFVLEVVNALIRPLLSKPALQPRREALVDVRLT